MTDPLAVLAREIGCTADLTSEHGRWELYRDSFDSLDLLYPALAPDDCAVRRSREIGVWRRAADLVPTEFDLPGWSDWLQLRLAHVPSRALLTALAEGGRTERIRRFAAATLKA
ncbi:hypothetical protein JNUCC0626_41735 [Lentzea sp. JNUCC 0626]|uniref:hypothetical protein n=1 Tax=Lentzea sp. JNUCC 0626 TaxID=3367513 RepID=UPI003749FB19